MIGHCGRKWDDRIPGEFTKRMGTLSLRVREARRDEWEWEIRRIGSGMYMDSSDVDESTASSDEARKASHDRAVNLLDESRADVRGLEQFAEEPDRHLTAFFAGRKPEMKRLRKRVGIGKRRHAVGERKPATGLSMLIAGVPGAGKTALMDRLADDWSDASEEARTPLAVEVPLRLLGKPEDLAAHVRTQFDGRASGGYLDRIRGFAVSILGNGIGFSVAGKERGADLKVVDRPVALMIDEIQNLVDHRDGPVPQILEDLHLGRHGAAIVPVFAGLAHSKEVLESAGISRLGSESVLSLGTLGEGEVAESVFGFMDRFKIRGERGGGGPGAHDFWAERIADWSDGWPMHLHGTLTALAGELARNEGHLDEVNVNAVRRRAADRRADYHGQRTAGPAGSRRLLLARVMHAIPKRGIFGDDCEALIENADEQGRQERTRLLRTRGTLPEGMSSKDMFDEMLRKGLLQSKAGNPKMFVCPIPSMRSWCASESGGEMHMAAMRGDAREIAELLRDGLDPNTLDMRGRSPLHLAVQGDWPEATRTLLELGGKANARDENGRTPLHLAATRRMEAEPGVSPGIVQLLTDAGADVHATDREGRSPLHVAAEFARSSEIARQLLDAGADTEATDKNGNTPLDVAIECDKGKIYETTRLLAALAPPGSAPGFEVAGAERFNARVERRDLMSSESGRAVLGEDSGTWSYVIHDSAAGSLDAPAMHGTGYASVDLACEAARAALDECKSAYAKEAERDAPDRETERDLEKENGDPGKDGPSL